MNRRSNHSNYRNKRRSRLHRHIYIAATSFVFIAALIFSIVFVSSKAYADNHSDSVKKYRSVIVYAGDTLESIAADSYSDECISMYRHMKEIASINNISIDTSLTPGNHIIVPYYESSNSYTFVVTTE